MMVVNAIIALALALMAWFIRVIDQINQSLHDFYGPEGTLKRIRGYQGQVGSGTRSK
jgi:hypothetical protein